ncbi:MAG: transposase [Bacteroidota bacterium]
MKKRKSIRLPEKDYSDAGEYFITIVTKGRNCYFGLPHRYSEVEQILRQIIEDIWLSIFSLHEESINHVLMPNHFHGIIRLQRENLKDIDHTDLKQRRRMRIPLLVGKFKTLTSKSINDYYENLGQKRIFAWQRNYYDRVVRNESELQRIYDYIEANPYNWDQDIFRDSIHSPEEIKSFFNSL